MMKKNAKTQKFLPAKVIRAHASDETCTVFGICCIFMHIKVKYCKLHVLIKGTVHSLSFECQEGHKICSKYGCSNHEQLLVK